MKPNRLLTCVQGIIQAYLAMFFRSADAGYRYRFEIAPMLMSGIKHHVFKCINEKVRLSIGIFEHIGPGF
ncbi:MAG: hypothetical protein COA90_11435 [Gammaproteobacteria bacterium]|nr:MAG: hypothetical protein COA90_11435 [Gammaproteobacteria bacterium]